MPEGWLCTRVDDIEDRISRVELLLDRARIGVGNGAAFYGSTWEISESQIAQWVAGTTVPLTAASSYVRFKSGNLEIRGGKFDIHTGETGAHMTMDGTSMLGYNTSGVNTISLDWSTGAIWAKKGGFGGTAVAPVIVLDDATAKVFVPQPIYLGDDDTGLVVGGSAAGVRYIQSNNYVAGTTGWRILNSGDAEFNNVVLRGSLYSTNVYINSDGVHIVEDTTLSVLRAVRFEDASANLNAYVAGFDDGTGSYILVRSTGATLTNYVQLDAESDATYPGQIAIYARSGASSATLFMNADSNAAGALTWTDLTTELFTITLKNASYGTINIYDNSDVLNAQFTQAGGLTLKHGLYVGNAAGTPTEDDIITDGSVNVGTGLYVGNAAGTPVDNAVVADGDIYYFGNLIPQRNSTGYYGYAYVPLTVPLTSTSWDGDARSDEGWTAIDLQTVFSAPAGIKAVTCFIMVRDSGTHPLTAEYFALAAANAGTTQVGIHPHGSDMLQDCAGVCACDANGDIWYTCNASGSSTMDVWLYITGYFI